ncbi:MAG: hypothetical protein NT175_00810 [Bacteroidetes bacterium]|nr:hypothetical protein [Bacteroidota bacterium]
MTLTDWTGTLGVTILLVAFFLNITDKISRDSLPYILLNLTGAGSACVAAILLKFAPFIVLEVVWSFVSVMALIKHFRQ